MAMLVYIYIRDVTRVFQNTITIDVHEEEDKLLEPVKDRLKSVKALNRHTE
jgi:hypothetical protein